MTPPTPPWDDPERLGRALARGPGCPALEKLAAAALGDLPEAEASAILVHAESCPACGAELALAASFTAEEADSQAVDSVVARLRASAAATDGRVIAFPAAAPRARRPSAAWVRWAAAALVVLGVGLVWQATRPTLPPEIAGPGGIDVVRGGEIEAVSPVGEVSGVPAELSWKPVPGAARYRVEVLDVAGESLGGGETVTAGFALPPELASRLHVRASYSWQVAALTADGRELARSERVEITLRPPGS